MSDRTFQHRVTALVMEFDHGDLPWKAVCPEHQLVVRGATRADALRALRRQASACLAGVKQVELTLLDLDEGGADG